MPNGRITSFEITDDFYSKLGTELRNKFIKYDISNRNGRLTSVASFSIPFYSSVPPFSTTINGIIGEGISKQGGKRRRMTSFMKEARGGYWEDETNDETFYKTPDSCASTEVVAGLFK